MSLHPHMAKVEYAIECLQGKSMPRPPETYPYSWDRFAGSDFKIAQLEIYRNCLREMQDSRFGKGSHASASTYRDGCRGPMCTYARSRSRSDRTGGVNFLSNDLIEYVTVMMWIRSTGYTDDRNILNPNKVPKPRIYEAHKNILVFYSRLKAQGLTEELDNCLDERFPFQGIPSEYRGSVELESPPAT